MALPARKPILQGSSWLNSVKSSITKMGVPVLVTSLTLSGFILGIRHLGFLQGAELAAYDHFIQSQPDQGRDDRLLIVGIDELDLQTLQEWPISDRTLANALKRLEAHQPSVIGIDVTRDIPIEPGRQALLQQLQTSDRVVTVCKVNSAKEFGFAPPPGIPLEKVGFADLVIDPGGILRRSLLLVTPPENAGLIIKKHLCNDPENTLTSFSLSIALKYLEKHGVEAEFTETGALKFGATVLSPFQSYMGGYQGADAGGFQLLLRYRSESNLATQVRLTDVLNNKVAPDLIRDRIVLIGYTTPQAKDDFYTPYSAGRNDNQKMPGVTVHGQSISQILGAVLDRQPLIWVWSFPQEALWVVGWSLIGGVLAWYLRHPLWFGTMVISVSGTIYLTSILIFFQGGWVPFIPALAALISTAVGVVLFDRFNNSVYGQTVYKTVKTFLKLEVDIDETKVEEQVAEITETDYFRDLQDTVKSLREQQKSSDLSFQPIVEVKSSSHEKHNEAQTKNRLEERLPQTDFFSPKPSLQNSLQNEDHDSLEFVQGITQNSNPVQEDITSTDADNYTLDFIESLKQESKRLQKDVTSTDIDDYELNFIESLKQESKRLQEEVTPPVPTEAEQKPQLYKEFRLDDHFIPTKETDEDLNYLDSLQQESQRLKNCKTEQ